MTLFLVGLGLGSEKDITVRGLECVRKADFVYLEHYTSLLSVGKEVLEEFYGRQVLLADRNLVEREAEERLLLPAKERDVCLLVVGDPFGATTHTDLVLRARKLGIKVEIIHNASILNAVGVVGLELYKYGRTTSIPFWEPGFEPETPYDVLQQNQARGLHTLFLLDIKVKEPSKEGIRKSATTGEEAPLLPPRFMTVNEGLRTLLAIEKKRAEGVLGEETFAIGIARLGQPSQHIVARTVRELLSKDFGPPLHCIVIPGNLQFVEEDALELWRT